MEPSSTVSAARDVSVSDLFATAELLKGSGQIRSAELLYSAWIEHNAEHPLLFAVLFNYSVILSDAGKDDAARGCLERALASNPGFLPAHINLGRIHERTGNAVLAVAQWSAALAHVEAITGSSITYKATALNQSARVLEGAAQDEAAEKLLRHSLEIDPQQREAVQHLVALRQRQCEWPVMMPSDRVDRKLLMEGMSPLSAAALTDDPFLQLALAYHYNKLDVGTPVGALPSWPRPASRPAKLRIGYLSSDLREHAVGYLMTEVFGLHDRNSVETFAYYCGPESRDPLHESFKTTADHWMSIGGVDDITASEKIKADNKTDVFG